MAGVSIDKVTGDISLSTRGAFSVPSVSGDSVDVFVCKPDALGASTSCGFESYWIGSLHGLTDGEVLGIPIGPAVSSVSQARAATSMWAATGLTIDPIATSTGADGGTAAFAGGERPIEAEEASDPRSDPLAADHQRHAPRKPSG